MSGLTLISQTYSLDSESESGEDGEDEGHIKETTPLLIQDSKSESRATEKDVEDPVFEQGEQMDCAKVSSSSPGNIYPKSRWDCEDDFDFPACKLESDDAGGKGETHAPTPIDKAPSVKVRQVTKEVDDDGSGLTKIHSLYRCPFCLFTFADRKELICHLPVHQKQNSKKIGKRNRKRGKPTRKYSCEHCSAEFSVSVNLASHMNMHDSSRPWKCSQCNFHFLTRGRLQAHERTHGQIVEQRNHQDSHQVNKDLVTKTVTNHDKLPTCKVMLTRCDHLVAPKLPPVCDKMPRVMDIPSCSEINSAGSQHKKVHNCPTCSTVFLSVSHRNRHVRTVHLRERLFSCSTCLKTFSFSYHLKEHSQIHIGSKRFGCHMCGKAFITLTRLKRHVKYAHENTRSHICRTCSKGFKRSDCLKRHMAIHTGVLRHKVQFLPGSFTTPRR